MHIAIDLDQFDNQFNILQEELHEVDYMLMLLRDMQYEDQINGKVKEKIINDQIFVISKQREYILNRKKFLIKTAETFNCTKHKVANSLEDAIRMLK